MEKYITLLGKEEEKKEAGACGGQTGGVSLRQQLRMREIGERLCGGGLLLLQKCHTGSVDKVIHCVIKHWV